MDLFKSLQNLADKNDKKFVIVGGHAVNFHGIFRSTNDIDLMIKGEDVDFWTKNLSTIGYEIFNQTKAFVQFKSKQVTHWPIDLILVDDSTFDKVYSSASFQNIDSNKIPFASILHLIAMKLHALKNDLDNRMEKDKSDLLELLKLYRVDLNSEEFRQLCEKYANIVVYEKITKK